MEKLIPLDLPTEITKCTKILQQFTVDKEVDTVIPQDVLKNAKGLVIMQVVKAGFIWSGRIGTGVVLARLSDGTWSCPSAIGTASIGFGAQVGGELTNVVIILNTQQAIEAFSTQGNVTLGGNLSVAAGPVGRNAEVSGAVSNVKTGQLASMYSYSKTQGLFVGVSLEGSVIVERKDANKAFYHRVISAKEILNSAIDRPAAADQLYIVLDEKTGSSSKPGTDNKPPVPDRPTTTSAYPIAVALYAYKGQREDDLSFLQGDQIEVTKKTANTNDWWQGRLKGTNNQPKNFPANYVEMR